jgi:hypothetical protein
MFPRGFDQLTVLKDEEEALAIDRLAELTLLHPGYVDEAGHDYGASSNQYRGAVERADRGLVALLEKVDLDRDLVIVTSDHGHSAAGGHGGADPEITTVLTCYAGRGVQHREELGHMSSTSIAPSISLLVGLRFPKNMRASDDDLDTIFSLTSSTAYSSEYIAERRQAVQRFRAENQRELGRRLSKPAASWAEWYANRRLMQVMRGGLALVLGSLAIALLVCFMRPRSSALDLVVWLVAVFATTYIIHRLVLGGFDFTCINKRARYITKESMVCYSAGLFGFAAHRVLWHDSARLLRDQTALVLATIVVELAHVFAFGWPLGFPLPGAAVYFLPFILSIFGVTSSILGLVAVIAAVFAKRSADAHRLRPR